MDYSDKLDFMDDDCDIEGFPIEDEYHGGKMNNKQIKYIESWEELREIKSPTHDLEIDLEGGCGWISPKESDKDSWEGRHYLSTHTFYGGTFKSSTEILQSCGFNVELANWDE